VYATNGKASGKPFAPLGSGVAQRHILVLQTRRAGACYEKGDGDLGDLSLAHFTSVRKSGILAVAKARLLVCFLLAWFSVQEQRQPERSVPPF
jgi:hypothetical protein